MSRGTGSRDQRCGGADALAWIGEESRIDLVITDYMMPRMDGLELARRIGKLDPDLPILLVTGYSDVAEAAHLPRLAKPFRQADLAARLAEVVEGAGNVVQLRPKAGKRSH